MRFSSPHLLYLAAIVPAVYLLYLILHLRRRKVIRQIGEPGLLDHFAPRPLKGRLPLEGLFACAALLCVTAALAGPQAGTRLEPVTITGSDIYLALDLSRSMSAEDMQGSRLERAKISAIELIRTLNGDRAGLILFSGEAFVQCPLTTDYNALTTFIQSLETDLTVSGGTNLSAPLRLAMESMKPEQDTYSMLLLMSDGENNAGDLEKTIRAVRARGIKVFCIGYGTDTGAPLPVYGERGKRTGFLKDEDGKVVISSLQENLLRGVAERSGGYYFRADRNYDEVRKLTSTLETMKKREIETRRFTVYEERFQIPLGGGILFFFLYIFTMVRARRVQI